MERAAEAEAEEDVDEPEDEGGGGSGGPGFAEGRREHVLAPSHRLINAVYENFIRKQRRNESEQWIRTHKGGLSSQCWQEQRSLLTPFIILCSSHHRTRYNSQYCKESHRLNRPESLAGVNFWRRWAC